MTNLEALQSLLEYKNDNLLAKALIDNGVTGTSTYSASNERDIDMAAVDVLNILKAHPDFREGSRYVTYSSGAIQSLIRELLRKHNALPVDVSVPVDESNNKLW